MCTGPVLTFVSCRDDARSAQLAEVMRSVIEANRRTGLRLESVDVDAAPERVVELGLLEYPAVIFTCDGVERTRLVGAQSRRAVLQWLLPELHHDPDAALAELRRQLDSPGEHFPRRVLHRHERVGRSARATMLGRIPMFASLSKRELTGLGRVATEVVLDAGSVLLREGEPVDGCWVIVAGTLSVRRGRRVVATLRAGEVVGEMALLDGGPRTATVTADERCVLLALDRAPFQAVLAGSPRLAITLLETMSRRLRDADAQLVD